ncbi:hypothetical protein D3C77_545310 [compost metagenome]
MAPALAGIKILLLPASALTLIMPCCATGSAITCSLAGRVTLFEPPPLDGGDGAHEEPEPEPGAESESPFPGGFSLSGTVNITVPPSSLPGIETVTLPSWPTVYLLWLYSSVSVVPAANGTCNAADFASAFVFKPTITAVFP